MAMLFARAKNRSIAPLKLKALTSLQRFNHTFTEAGTAQAQFCPQMGSDSVSCRGHIDMKKWRAVDARLLGIKRSMIPQPSWMILNALRNKGFEAYLVGGCVRDLLLNRIPKDFDIITTADLKQIKKRFNRAIIFGRRFPICQVHVKGSKIEVSSFNTVAQQDGQMENIVLPQMPNGCDAKDFIRWNNSMQRDFTINSLFFDPFSYKIYDYANGIADLRSLKLRTLIPAQLSFKEDCARILRGLRIAARLGLSFSKETEAAMCNLSSSIQSLDKFRLMLELNYMLSYGAAEPSLCLLRRFNLLQILFPFHAAYLDQQIGKNFDQKSNMLMKLFFNLDKLVSCGRPSDCSLWVGLLAFHLALVNNPQDALVLWTFASVLYHGKWSEGVKFAREHAKGQVNFEPEFLGLSPGKSDEELAKEVSQLASLVQVSLGALSEAEILAKLMSRYPGFPCSGVVFVSKKTVQHVHRIFDVLVEHIESFEHGRQSFMIDYNLLMKGNNHEIRLVFGKIVLQTISGGLLDEGKDVAEQLHDGLLSDNVEENFCPTPSDPEKHQILVKNIKKHGFLSPNPETKQKMAKKIKLVENKQGLSEGELSTEGLQVIIEKEFLGKAKEHRNEVETCHLPDLCQLLQQETRMEREQTAKNEEYKEMAQKHMKLAEKVKHGGSQNTAINKRPEVSAKSNGSWDKKIKPEKLLERKDCDVLVRTEIKERTEGQQKEKMVEEKNSRRSLSSIFRR